ncbi:MAG TPA: globin domain-containing protein [Mycobacterium sp.]|nr:globin domain-containing protein [Mycobacterium sp.]
MAIALDGGYPDDTPLVSFAGQQARSPFGRRRVAHHERLFSLTDPHRLFSARIADSDAIDDVAGPQDWPALSESEERPAEARDFDARLVKESFSHLTENPDLAMEHFYARLFVCHPEIRSMFPHAMHDHMERVFDALARIVWHIDNPDSLIDYLSRLGRGHRKFGVKERHYEPFLTVLAETVRHFNGHNWTAKTQAAWDAALGRVSSAMLAAAERDAALQPPWWVGEVVQHDQRRPDLAVLTIKPDQPLHYTPGQYVAVQVPRWPRVWRNFSIANAPRENGLIDLHVRGVRGGMVSGSLVHNTRPGDTLLLGRACGEMTDSADPETPLLCIAGGTGLAPIKAIIEGVINASKPGRRREIVLFFGARSSEDLYDLPDLRVLEWIYSALTVIPVVAQQEEFDGINGSLPDVAARYAKCEGREIFVSGPEFMVRQTVALLADRVRPGQIRYDPPESAR